MTRAEKCRNKKLAYKGAKKEKLIQVSSPLPAKQEQTLTIQQAIDLAVQHHNAGDLPKAEGIYQQILQADQNQPVALHLLGVIAHQVGKNDIAIDLITKALAIKPDYTESAWNLSGTAENISKAKSWIEHCLRADPSHLKAKLTLSALKFYEGDKAEFNALMQSSSKSDPYMRSFA